MNSVRFPRLSRVLLVAVSAACFTVNFAAAQASHGKFVLPVETHWGRALLPAGAYTFSLTQASQGGMFTVHRNGMTVVIPLTGAISTGKVSERSELLLVTERQGATVRSVHLGHLGLTAVYRAPRREAPVLAQVPKLEQHVQISERGK